MDLFDCLAFVLHYQPFTHTLYWYEYVPCLPSRKCSQDGFETLGWSAKYKRNRPCAPYSYFVAKQTGPTGSLRNRPAS